MDRGWRDVNSAAARAGALFLTLPPAVGRAFSIFYMITTAHLERKKRERKRIFILKLTAPRIGAWRKICARTDAHIQVKLAASSCGAGFPIHLYRYWTSWTRLIDELFFGSNKLIAFCPLALPDDLTRTDQRQLLSPTPAAPLISPCIITNSYSILRSFPHRSGMDGRVGVPGVFGWVWFLFSFPAPTVSISATPFSNFGLQKVLSPYTSWAHVIGGVLIAISCWICHFSYLLCYSCYYPILCWFSFPFFFFPFIILISGF